MPFSSSANCHLHLQRAGLGLSASPSSPVSASAPRFRSSPNERFALELSSLFSASPKRTGLLDLALFQKLGGRGLSLLGVSDTQETNNENEPPISLSLLSRPSRSDGVMAQSVHETLRNQVSRGPRRGGLKFASANQTPCLAVVFRSMFFLT